MDVINAINKRRSVKSFISTYQISDEEINKLISTTMLSPTAFNIQNWRFVIIRDNVIRKQIREYAWGQGQITDASLLIALCADLKAWKKSPERYWSHVEENIQKMIIPTINRYYQENPQLQRDEAFRSCGIAAQSLMLTAQSMGYDSCPMIGFDFAKVGKLIRLPSDHILTMLVAIGKTTGNLWERGGNLPYNEVVFDDHFLTVGESELVEQQDYQTKQIQQFRAGVYRHYKGAHYLALGLAREDHSNETMVVYTRLYERDGLPLSTRTLSEWNSLVLVEKEHVPRFLYVGQMNE